MRKSAVLLAMLVCLPGCREADGTVGPGEQVSLQIMSDPPGGRIVLDGDDTGFRAPAALSVSTGEHDLLVHLDTAGYRYRYDAVFRITRSDTALSLNAPVALQCPVDFPGPCYAASRVQVEKAGLRFAVTPRGALFHWDGNGQGIFYPATSVNSYAASGVPVMAGTTNTGARVSLGIYDHAFFAGRPAPSVVQDADSYRMTHTSWIVPPAHASRSPQALRGIEVTQEVLARNAVEQVVLMRLVFRNVSHQRNYSDYALHVDPSPVTYRDAWIGFLLDPDIGVSSDDLLSYDADLDMVYAYDRSFSEPGFIGDGHSAPALVGMRALRTPPGTSVLLNGYALGAGGLDWSGGTGTEVIGADMLTGRQPFTPDHPHPRIGHLPHASGDVRMSVTAGPLTLAPGEQAEIVLAVAVASPAAGTFVTEQEVQPGNPTDTTRQIHAIAAVLRERMRAALALLED